MLSDLLQNELKSMLHYCLQGVMYVTSAVTRNFVKLQAENNASSALSILENGIYRAAACMACNHRDLSSASMTCVLSIIGK